MQKVHRSFKFESSKKDKYAPLVEAFRRYYEGKENVMVIRFRFDTYKQTNENMECFIRDLKSWIGACEYGELEDSLLRNRLICGVQDKVLRDKLLRTRNLTLEKCLNICRLSEQGTAELAVSEPVDSTQGQVDAITWVSGCRNVQHRLAPT